MSQQEITSKTFVHSHVHGTNADEPTGHNVLSFCPRTIFSVNQARMSQQDITSKAFVHFHVQGTKYPAHGNGLKATKSLELVHPLKSYANTHTRDTFTSSEAAKLFAACTNARSCLVQYQNPARPVTLHWYTNTRYTSIAYGIEIVYIRAILGRKRRHLCSRQPRHMQPSSEYVSTASNTPLAEASKDYLGELFSVHSTNSTAALAELCNGESLKLKTTDNSRAVPQFPHIPRNILTYKGRALLASCQAALLRAVLLAYTATAHQGVVTHAHKHGDQ
ncbi:hypothetical protein e1004f01.tmp0015 [Eimeria tenella]|uniref:Uncharacterized protein n=1 Tax=Eimeria tenella TaxID=5802 RepID=C8TE16_EIMTE|nr:hypothetical protein e1004f01.tmp0015 [Eimeria tenella]